MTVAMSALGSGFPQKVMSALPSIADMCSANGNVRFGPEADITREQAARVRETQKKKPPAGGLKGHSHVPNYPS